MEEHRASCWSKWISPFSTHTISDCTRISLGEKKPQPLPASCAMSGTRKRYECTNEMNLAIIIIYSDTIHKVAK